jgi:acetoacetyl-CoA synthetase
MQGIRFGSAELYNVMEQFKTEVMDCIVVGRKRPEDIDETIMMCLKLQAGLKLSEALTDAIRQNIRTSLSPRHIPGFILQVKDIPYTANGKKVENAVRVIVSGIDGKDSGTVVNPECLAEYSQFAKLEGSSADLLRAKRDAKI